ncbi:MAG: PAS domain-containing sensor histidine kinase [Fimbriimonadaceae bacterium]|nr:PAS domain-containing sensor histidine kinase [Fimbriimonadaceae bacterium]
MIEPWPMVAEPAQTAPAAVLLIDPSGGVQPVDAAAADLLRADDGALALLLGQRQPFGEAWPGAPTQGRVESGGRSYDVSILPRGDGSSVALLTAAPAGAPVTQLPAGPWRAWLEDAPALVVLLDPEHRAVAANRRLRELLGVDAGELLQQPFLRWVAPSAQPAALAALEAAGTLPECRLVADSGVELVCEWEVAAVRQGERRWGSWVFLRDITRHQASALEMERYTHELERLYVEVEQRRQELEDANQALRQARLEALAAEELARLEQMKTAFLDVAAHELRTPVTLLAGALEYLDQPVPAASREALLGAAQRSTRRLTEIVDTALKLLGNGEAPRPDNFLAADLDAVLQAAATDVEPFVSRRGQELRVRLAGGLPALQLDRSMIRDVATNLLMNAIKFTPDGGLLELTSRRRPGGVEFEVRDSGLGIRSADLPLVFEQFFCSLDTRNHSSGDYEFNKRGPGFGLAIVRKFVELHGGQVTVRNNPQGGCTFTVALPLR